LHSNFFDFISNFDVSYEINKNCLVFFAHIWH
jgi:hypothetical protein